jgi:hypothetical protein
VLREENQPKRALLTGTINYRKLPLEQARDEQKTNGVKSPVALKRSQRTSPVNREPTFNQHARDTPDVEVEGSPKPVKRAYYHGILNLDEHKKQLTFENHIEFNNQIGDLGPGQVFGARTLLDAITFSKHIQQNNIRFEEQLAIPKGEFIEKARLQIEQAIQCRTPSKAKRNSTGLRSELELYD